MAANVKRKRDPKTAAPRKRSRSESVSSDESTDGAERILFLETAILESKKNYNNIVALLTIAREESDGHGSDDEAEDGPALTASVSLCRVFLRLLAGGQLAAKKGLGDKDKVVVGWLKERLSEYEDVLVSLLAQPKLATTALTLTMRLLQAQGQYHTSKAADDKVPTDKKMGKKAKTAKAPKAAPSDYYFPLVFFRRILRALVEAPERLGPDAAEALLDEFAQKYLVHDDVRFYTFKAVGRLLDGRTGAPVSAANVEGAFALLSRIEDVPAGDEALDNFFVAAGTGAAGALRSTAQHKKQAQEAWIAVLARADSQVLRKRALAAMEGVIAPWFVRPELLLDYLTDCYDAGGATSLLALSGLWYLIRERNVDYPAFYAKLYSLLDGAMLHSRHRSRVFRLLDTFLTSSHLPAQMVASFVKRLARLCLYAPPAAIVSVVPWLYNMFRRHPLCTFMLHRVPRSAAEREQLAREGLADPFSVDEADPMETGAIDSCLWEIVQLQTHHHPNVATIAKILSEQFTKQSYNLEDFLDHSYQSLLDAELAKEVRKAPVVEFQIPKRIFFPHDPADGVEDGLLVKLWKF